MMARVSIFGGSFRDFPVAKSFSVSLSANEVITCQLINKLFKQVKRYMINEAIGAVVPGGKVAVKPGAGR